MTTLRQSSVVRSSSGITLVETVLSLLIIGGAMVAALNTIVGARASQAVAAQQRLGLLLAEDLMAEVLSQAYREKSGLFGLEIGENIGHRRNFDDIDDYAGWTSSPPTDLTGNAIAGAEGYTRSVEIRFVQLGNPSTTANTDEGMIRITVTVRRGDKKVSSLTAYRSDVYDTSRIGY